MLIMIVRFVEFGFLIDGFWFELKYLFQFQRMWKPWHIYNDIAILLQEIGSYFLTKDD